MGSSGRTDMERIGLFQEMGYLHGCPHNPPTFDFNQASHKGTQMMTNSTKPKTSCQDGYFERTFNRVFSAEAYTDPIRQRRLRRLEETKKNIVPIPFKPTSPTKEWTGPGTYYGTFEGVIESFSPVQRPVVRQPLPGRNVITNPPKKGTGYGFADVTIDKFPAYYLEGEYEKLKGKQVITKKKVPDDKKPFILGMNVTDYFDGNPYFTAKPGPIYLPYTYLKLPRTPFIPPTVPKLDGGMKAGCFDKFPEYKANEYHAVSFAARGPVHVVNKSGKTYVPVPGPKKMPTKSIVAYNVHKAMNSENYSTVKGVVYCK